MDAKPVRRAAVPEARQQPSATLRRRKPRSFEEWQALSAWRRLPSWEVRSSGYELRRAREAAGLSQVELAARLGVSQQAVARAERWESNPTLRFVENWASALGGRLRFRIEGVSEIDDPDS